MSYIGKPVKEDEIKRTVAVPDVQIVSVPERPSERAARRRKLWEGPMVEPDRQPVEVPQKEGETCH